MKIVFTTLILIWTLGLQGCGKVTEEVSDKEYVIDLLNNREYEESIAVLKDLVEENPNEHQYKVLLASAYGGSVGIDLVSSFGMFAPAIYQDKATKKKLQTITREVDTAAKKTPKPDRALTLEKKLEKNLLRIIENLSTGFAVFFGKAEVPVSERRKLVEALLVLSYVPPTSESYVRAKSYSAFLNLVQFLNYTKDAFPSLVMSERPSVGSLVCAFEPGAFFGNLVDSTKYVANAADDVLTVSKITGKKISDRLVSLKTRALKINSTYYENKDSLLALDIILGGAKGIYCE